MRGVIVHPVAAPPRWKVWRFRQMRGGWRLPGPAGKLKLAFEVGFEAGEALDNATGLSDWLSGTDDHLIITKEVKNAGKPPA